MKKNILWFLLFLGFMGIGFFHGISPKSLSKNIIQSPKKFTILTVDELLITPEVREELEDKLKIQLTVQVEKDWERLVANLVSSNVADLIQIPSYWANSLAQQKLLLNLNDKVAYDSGTFRFRITDRIASDFLNISNQGGLFFAPLYWVKTGFIFEPPDSFLKFLKDDKSPTLHLLRDEDLLLEHFKLWNQQGLLPLINKKNIITFALEDLTKGNILGVHEVSLAKESPVDGLSHLSAFLVFGSAIPAGANNKNLSGQVMALLFEKELNERTLLKTPFNSTLRDFNSDSISLNRRAQFIRDLRLIDTIHIPAKNPDARTILKDEFDFQL